VLSTSANLTSDGFVFGEFYAQVGQYRDIEILCQVLLAKTKNAFSTTKALKNKPALFITEESLTNSMEHSPS
jgi:hypothetical protein